MKRLISKAWDYLQSMHESLGHFEPVSAAPLPLFLRSRYELYEAKLFGISWILAVEAEDWEPGTPAEYRQQMAELSEAVGQRPVVFVLPRISSTVRNRLVRMGVPFIVPNTQIHLPSRMVSLKEVFDDMHMVQGKHLSPVAQVVVLGQILHGEFTDRSAQQISDRLGYSRPSLSNAYAELEQRKLCEVKRRGKEQHLSFSVSPRELWEQSFPFLRSPVRKTTFVLAGGFEAKIRLAGISALARQTHLTDDRIPTKALAEGACRKAIENGSIRVCADPHDADTRLEAWRYHPDLLSRDEVVDTLSLFLSLREDPDERVQLALADLMEAMVWR